MEKNLLNASDIKFAEVWLNGHRGLYANIPVNEMDASLSCLFVYHVNGEPTSIKSWGIMYGPMFVKSASLSSGVLIFDRPIEVITASDLDGDVVYLESHKFAIFFPANMTIESYLYNDNKLKPCLHGLEECAARDCRMVPRLSLPRCNEVTVVSKFLDMIAGNRWQFVPRRNGRAMYNKSIRIKLEFLSEKSDVYSDFARLIDEDISITTHMYAHDGDLLAHANVLFYHLRGETPEQISDRIGITASKIRSVIAECKKYFRKAYSENSELKSIQFIYHIEDLTLQLNEIRLEDLIKYNVKKSLVKKLHKSGCDTAEDLKRLIDADIELYEQHNLTYGSSHLYAAIGRRYEFIEGGDIGWINHICGYADKIPEMSNLYPRWRFNKNE